MLVILETEAKSIMYGMSNGLAFLHSLGLVHRDIKPANFLMGPDLSSSSGPSSCDRVNVIDFGLAKKYTNSRTGEHIKNSQCDSHGVGTPLFASINTHNGEGIVADSYVQ